MFFLAGFTLQVSPNSCRSALDLERNMKRNLWEALASFSATYHRMTSLLTSLSGSVWKGKRNNIFFRGMWTNVWKRVEIGKKGAVFGVGFSQHCLYRSAFCRCLVGCSVLHYSFVRAPLVQKTLMASAKPSWWSHLPDSTKGRKKCTGIQSQNGTLIQHEICWPRHASCQEANAQRHVVIHVISCYSECVWKFHVNAPSGQRELLVAVRLFCLMCVPCKVRSANKFLFLGRGKKRTMHPMFSSILHPAIPWPTVCFLAVSRAPRSPRF